MQEKLGDRFNERLEFREEARLPTNGKVNRQNVHMWSEENPYATIKHEGDSPKINVFTMTYFFVKEM